MRMSVQIFRGKGEIVIAGIPTQWVAERVIKDINDLIHRKGSDLVYFFEGSPGIYGDGLVIKIVLSRFLGENEVGVLVKYFELRNARIDVY
ncbi:MAG: hypothetical protein QN229_03115 [Desulfurococcaceae archaeon TW002]